MTTRNLWLFFLVVFAAGALSLAGCSPSDDDDGGDDGGIVNPPADNVATCEGCHTSEAMLKATALPDEEPPESEGEG